MRRKNILFDPRNLLIARVHMDPLGKVFGLARFHKTQVRNLLISQLVPAHSKRRIWRITTKTTKQGIETSKVTEVQRQASPTYEEMNRLHDNSDTKTILNEMGYTSSEQPRKKSKPNSKDEKVLLPKERRYARQE